jgi:hypothetical protein
MIDLADDRLTVDAAATLMGLGRRQIYRLRRIFSADGPAGLASRKRGRPSNRKYGETFRAAVLSLVREHYLDFGPTLAVEKLVARHGLRIGVETLRQWMMADRLWVDRRHNAPSVSITAREDFNISTTTFARASRIARHNPVRVRAGDHLPA